MEHYHPWPFPVINGDRTEDSKAALAAKPDNKTPYQKAQNEVEESTL